MKKSTYAIITLIAVIVLCEVAIFLKIKSTEHLPINTVWEYHPYDTQSAEPQKVGTLTVEVDDDWSISVPYGTLPDSVPDAPKQYLADTLVVIAPNGHIRVY